MSGEMPAARTTDPTVHLPVPAAPGPGAPTVLIGGLPAWRALLDTHACVASTPMPHGAEKCYMGSTTVLINNQMACRMTDILQGLGPPNPFSMGCPTVVIGDNGFGMAATAAKGGFSAAMRKLLDGWDTSTRPERLKAIQAALNAALPPGMQPLSVSENVFLDPDTLGQFGFRKWSVQINPRIMNGSMDAARMAKLCNTAYHEARHAEQWWNMAQHRVAQGASAVKIAQEMAIPTSVARAAGAHPAEVGTSEGAMGETVFEAVYGSRRVYRNRVLEFGDKDAYAQYRALPEEQDAWREGDDAELNFRALDHPSQREND
jgi:uncharacterized Zn-binding protein involved in type VI secretion